MAKPLGGAFYLTQCFVPNNFSPISVQQPQKGKRSLRKKRKNKKKTKMRGHIYVCIECVIPINPFSPDWEIGLATNLICIFSLVGLKLTEYCHVTHLYILYIALST